MQVYLVGGAVRDRLLGKSGVDRDYVVVGATQAQMEALGYKAVGRDFPVFLHPDTHEEYALARTERKTGPGYRGFVVDAAPDVTLEDDLRRRDLTINAMAQDEHGRLVDPFGGKADLDARVLRHVSDAFVEDPVRVLRVARFAARYAPLGFRIAEETLALMRHMAESGEVDHLVPERVWQELRKALSEPRPSAFLQALRAGGALVRLFPEIDALYGVPQRAEFHPEVDTGVHTEMVVDMAARLAPGDSLVGFCALVHDLGKALTPADVLPKHIGHENAGVAPIRALSRRIKPPGDYVELALLCCKLHLKAHMALELRAGTVLDLLEALGALRRPERLDRFLLVCEADKRGRLGKEDDAYPQADYLRRALAAAQSVSTQPLLDAGFEGPKLGERLRAERIRAIDAVRRAQDA